MLASQNIPHFAIEQLQIEKAEDHPLNSLPVHVLVKSLKDNKLNSYPKHEFFSRSLNYILPTHPPHTQSNEILTKYFTYTLNPIYEKISKLPQQIFICGYCKEFYYGPSEYLLHCLETDCPINHNRSTYFFYFKKKISQIKNSDIQKTLNQNQLKEFRSISYRKKTLLFSNIDIKPIQKNSQHILFCGKCGYKYQNLPFILRGFFINHCVLFCKSSNNPKNSHILIPMQCQQDLIAFVDDIINLAVNYNVISFYNNSYVRIQENLKFSNLSPCKYSCANCKQYFTHQTDFIQHCLFECKEKPNQKSSHLFQRKMVKVPRKVYKIEKIKEKQAKIYLNQQKKQQQKNQVREKIGKRTFQKNQEQNKQKKISKKDKISIQKWDKSINPDFEEYTDLLQNIYFCGQCLSHFSDIQSYLSHCFFYLCQLNQKKNSHFFFQKDSKTPLSMKTIKIFINEARIERPSTENPQIQKAISQYIQLVNAETQEMMKPGKIDNFYCGKCGQNFKKQYFYINHCLKICYSENNQKNSHIIRYLQKKVMNDDQFKDFIKSYLYAIQILQFSPYKKYKVTKNEFIDVDSDFLCGKCDTLFGNLYEYVLHSIQVCGNMRCKYSSHFINQNVIRSKAEIETPLDVVFGQNLSSKFWKNKKTHRIEKDSEKSENHEPMEIEIETITASERNCIAKIQNFSQEKDENQTKENENQENQNLFKRLSSQLYEKDLLPRFLRSNPDFEYNGKTGYYCGKCEVSLKTEEDFQYHLKECQSFQHQNSSHLLVQNSRYEELFINQIIESKNYKKFFGSFPEFEQVKHSNFNCGCGQTGPVNKFNLHIKNHHKFQIPQGSSHVFLRVVFYKYNNQIMPIPLPVGLEGTKPDQKWVCPCKPWKSYSYQEFVNHIIKRHEGKSPKLWMKFKDLE